MTPTQTGTAAVTTAGISAVLAWLLPLVAHVSPPADVVTALAALVFYVAHLVQNVSTARGKSQ